LKTSQGNWILARSHNEYLKAKREGMARLRARDPDAARRKQKDWNERNRQRVRDKIRTYHNRRFFWAKCCRLRREGNAATPFELACLWKKQRGLCGLTGERLSRKNAELDHILPKARGGDGSIGNLRWVTKVANRAKRDMTDDEFFLLCNNVMRWIGTRIQMVDDMTKEKAAEAA
jgi:CRISPR/Cas system Type II protein with McrA/HNH and RuvC-like nuclease domain